MIDFVPQKNAFIFQGNHKNKEDYGKYNEPGKEHDIGNWLVLFRAAGSQIFSATLSFALREREFFSISTFAGGMALRVNTFSEGTVLQVHRGKSRGQVHVNAFW
jgi:hypothetical protein